MALGSTGHPTPPETKAANPTKAAPKKRGRPAIELTWEEGNSLKEAVDNIPELAAIFAKFGPFTIASPF